MKYINKKTGAMFSSPFVISGGDWVKVEDQDQGSDEEKVNIGTPDKVMDTSDKVTDTPDEKQIVEEVVEVIDVSSDGIDGITVKEIKQELDAFGIKYDPRMKKQELYELMLNGK